MALDLRILVEEVLATFGQQAPDRRITSSLPAEPAIVEADSLRIEQVLTNLLDNANKYSPPGGPIEVALVASESTVRVSVTDHGEGIAPEHQQHLFSRFFRALTGASLRQTGLGLGLYICKEIVERHGGAIGVDSEIGRGSTFYFVLPRGGPRSSEPA
jgi:signal transduction histidine kinase